MCDEQRRITAVTVDCADAKIRCLLAPRAAVWALALSCAVAWGCDVKGVYLGSDVRVDGGGAGSSTAGRGGGAKGGGAHADSGNGNCPAGFGDCDGDPSNGCEADLSRDREHCGACGVACIAPDCTCDSGTLASRCSDERADCDGDPKNGCEVDISTDATHCGECGHVCQLGGHDSFGAMCTEGKCHLICEAYHADCDGDVTNGCEVVLLFDNKNCGACGVACTCSNGTCQ